MCHAESLFSATLTFWPHAHVETLFEATLLTLAPHVHVHLTVVAIFTLVHCILRNGPPEETWKKITLEITRSVLMSQLIASPVRVNVLLKGTSMPPLQVFFL